MADDEKAALYKRLVRDSNEAAVVEAMQVNGFWPVNKPVPRDPLSELKERADLDGEIGRLLAQQSKVKDPVAALAEERKRRWAESRKRRRDAREARQAAARKRRAAWLLHKASQIVHLGAGVSAGLQSTQSDVAELTRRGLPILHNGGDLAKALGIPLGTLRWLTYHRRGTTLVHYHRFGIPKKTGGTRSISAPKTRLAAAQRWVFARVMGKLDAEPPAHGFVRHRSVVTNAAPHIGRAVVINMDLKDFFPTVTFRRVKGLFRKVGYSEHVATVLALLCTEPPRAEATHDGRTWYVALGERVLPQGACTSPAITNALCRRMDRRLVGLARHHDFTYTRYADDLTFSGDKTAVIGRLMRSIRTIVTSEGFMEHPTKSCVMRASQRQEVTGVTVNTKLSVPRDELRQLRAILHNCARRGLASQNRDGHHDFAAHLRGRVEYACMIDPDRAPAFHTALAAALAGPGGSSPPP